MGLNKSRGNMYPWVDYTWNPIKGCLHQCSYCYLKAHKDFDFSPRLEYDELFTNLLEGKTIFIGSASDMFGDWVLKKWILHVLDKCRHANNRYLFQSKNPLRYLQFLNQFPRATIFGTTIETNWIMGGISKAPTPEQRLMAMKQFKDYERMISIEPIMDFEPEVMITWMKDLKPSFVSIGADSKEHDLKEPSKEKLVQLIYGLTEAGVQMKLKKNLNRILKKKVKSPGRAGW